MDLEGIVVGLIGGGIVASLVSYYLASFKFKRKETLEVGERTETIQLPPEKVEEARKELKILRIEKELLSSALTKLYEAEAKGRIGREEKEALVSKYRERLKELDEKISSASAIVELSELENAREEILKLMNVKLNQIERRLEELRSRVGIPSTVVKQPITEEKHVEEKPKKKKGIEEDRWSKMVEEVNEALAKLEQIELE